MAENEQRKLEAEIEQIRAQTARTVAETAHLEAERKASHQRFGHWLVESLKVIGALVVGAGGLMAAFTGYQLTEIRKEKMELSLEKLNNDLRHKTEEFDAASQRKNDLDLAVTNAQEQFTQTQADLEQLKVQLMAQRQSAPPDANVQGLDNLIAQTDKIKLAVGTTDSQLRSAAAGPASGNEWQIVFGDYENEDEAEVKKKAVDKLGFTVTEVFGTKPHLHMRVRVPSKKEASAGASQIIKAKVSHEPEVIPPHL